MRRLSYASLSRIMDVEGDEALFSQFFWSDDFAAELALAEGNIISEIAPQ